MDKKLDIILDIIQPNTHRNDSKVGNDDNNDGKGGGLMSDSRRFSTGTGSTGISGMMMSAGNSQESSRIMSRTHSMEIEEGQEITNVEAESDCGHSNMRKHGIEFAGTMTENRGLESSELTKRLERLKDEEDVLRRRIHSTTSNDISSKARIRTQSSRFTVTPSLYTPDNELSRETIDIDLDDVMTANNKTENIQDKRLAGNSSSNKNALSEISQQQRHHHQKPFGGNLKKYQSAPSLPPPPKHKSLKDNHSNTDFASLSPSIHGGVKDSDFRRSSSVHFDESSLVKHRSQSEIFPVCRDPGFMTSTFSQPSLMPHDRSSSMTLQSLQQKHLPDIKATSLTTSNLSANDIRGNAYVSDIDSSDEANSSKDSTPSRERSAAITPHLSSRESIVPNSNNSIESVDKTQQQQQQQHQQNKEITEPLTATSSKEEIQANDVNSPQTSTQQPVTSTLSGDSTRQQQNFTGNPSGQQNSLISETTFSSPILIIPKNENMNFATSSDTTQNPSNDKSTSSSVFQPPPVQETRRKSEPLNTAGKTSTTISVVNSNGNHSKSAFDLNC